MNKLLQLFTLLVFFQSSIIAQISGIIKDTNGNTLPFAAIYIKGTTTGTFSNEEGEYRLNLEKGKNTVVFKYVGFETKEIVIQNNGGKLIKNITLKTDDVILNTVTITADAEDPAYAIIRKAIKARKHFNKKPESFKAKIYQKFKLELMDAPETIMGIKLVKTEEDKKEMEEMLDSNTNVLLVTETVSEFYKGKNNKWKETIISSRISGDKKGYSNMSSLFTKINFYNDFIPMGRKLISPISKNAMFFYKFKLIGTFTDNNGNLINKIKVIPKRKYDPVFEGFIFITENIWNISGINVFVSSKNTNISLLDSINIKQDYKQISDDKKEWGLLSQYATFQIGFLGFKAKGYHTRNFVNYELNQQFPNGFFDKIKIKIDEESNKRDSVYWKKIRPVPLSIKERKGYFKMDSIERVQSSKNYLDSIDKISNKLSFINIITSYTHQNSYNNSSWKITSPLLKLGFNPVQGINAELNFRYKKQWENKTSIKFLSSVQFGFADKRLLPKFQLKQMLDNKHKFEYSIKLGDNYFQPSDKKLVNPFFNLITSLYSGKNYLKLYEKKYINFIIKRNFIPGIKTKFFIEYTKRNKLINHSDLMFITDHFYSPNIYEETGKLNYTNKFNFKIRVSYKPGTKYLDMPHQLIPIYSNYPTFYIEYEKALAIDNSFVSYDCIRGGMTGYLSTGIFGFLNYKLEAGKFLTTDKVDLIDDNYFSGNQIYFMGPNDFKYSYHLLPYYYSSNFKPWMKIQFQQKLKGLIISKIPLLNRLKAEESLSANLLHLQGQDPYYEFGIGLEKILGVLSFRYSWSFKGKYYYHQGIRLTYSLPISLFVD